jgi:hypothetical protein
MAIFILGIGVISIASLFPAGIQQQQQSADDVLGPTVARNAMAVLRSKLTEADFAPRPFPLRVEGDFPWVRPAFFFENQTVDGEFFVPAGSISVFRGGIGSSTETEVPYNDLLYEDGPPTVVITQGERSYPMSVGAFDAETARQTQYYWDCMFRRFQGRVQVAVFVYRVVNPPGERLPYVVAPNPSETDLPPLPIALDLTDPANQAYSPIGAWDAFPFGTPPAINVIPGTPADTYDPFDARQAWQQPRQWILDQNNNIHRVLGQFRDDSGDLQIELLRPVPEMPAALDPADAGYYVPVYYWNPSQWPTDSDANGLADQDVVQLIWYLPTIDPVGRTLVPVYVAVEEL